MKNSEPTPLRGRAGLPDVAGDHLNAERFLGEHGQRLRRSPELGQWFVWNGAWWDEDRLDHVPQMAAASIENLRNWVAEAGGPEEFQRRSRHYRDSAKASRRGALLDLAGTHPDIVVAVDQLDAHPLLVACKNGTVDLSTGELREADPDDLLTRGIAVNFDPEAHSELFVRFLDDIFAGDHVLIAFVQRVLGYCVTGEVRDHVLPVFSGVGANGKSTLVGVVQDLLRDMAITAPEGLVIQRRHEPHPERLAVLRGRRLVVSAELEEHAVLAEGLVKMLTGGDTLSARELYGRRFNFRPSHKVVLVTNYQPRVHGVDHAIWRRLKVIPFDVIIPAERQDPTLRRRLVEEEGAAVLAWLVRGAVDWHRNGLGEAPAVKAATEEYKHSQDRLGAFLQECTVAIEGRTKVADLLRAWRAWCAVADIRPGRDQDFVQSLKVHGITVGKYQGTSLASEIGLR